MRVFVKIKLSKNKKSLKVYISYRILKFEFISGSKWKSRIIQLVRYATFFTEVYSLLSSTSLAKQSYAKITYTGRSVLAYENGYDGDSALLKRPYRPVLYRRSHIHEYICIFLRVITAKCISSTS